MVIVMSRSLDWKGYVNDVGDFELPNYLFRMNNDLMKQALDLGTLLSDDKNKLRAYREQIKKTFKRRWMELAEALEFYDLIVPCGCSEGDYCTLCGGSRYRLNEALTPDQMREVAYILGAGEDAELAAKLQKGLMKALKEVDA